MTSQIEEFNDPADLATWGATLDYGEVSTGRLRLGEIPGTGGTGFGAKVAWTPTLPVGGWAFAGRIIPAVDGVLDDTMVSLWFPKVDPGDAAGPRVVFGATNFTHAGVGEEYKVVLQAVVFDGNNGNLESAIVPDAGVAPVEGVPLWWTMTFDGATLTGAAWDTDPTLGGSPAGTISLPITTDTTSVFDPTGQPEKVDLSAGQGLGPGSVYSTSDSTDALYYVFEAAPAASKRLMLRLPSFDTAHRIFDSDGNSDFIRPTDTLPTIAGSRSTDQAQVLEDLLDILDARGVLVDDTTP